MPPRLVFRKSKKKTRLFTFILWKRRSAALFLRVCYLSLPLFFASRNNVSCSTLSEKQNQSSPLVTKQK